MMCTDQDYMSNGPWVKHSGMRLRLMGYTVRLKFKAQVGLGTPCRTELFNYHMNCLNKLVNHVIKYLWIDYSIIWAIWYLPKYLVLEMGRRKLL